MPAKRRAASATSSFSIMCIMLILPIMFLVLCNKLENAHKGTRIYPVIAKFLFCRIFFPYEVPF